MCQVAEEFEMTGGHNSVAAIITWTTYDKDSCMFDLIWYDKVVGGLGDWQAS